MGEIWNRQNETRTQKKIKANKETKKAAKLAKGKDHLTNINKDDIGKSNDDDYLIHNNVTKTSTDMAISININSFNNMMQSFIYYSLLSFLVILDV